MLCSVEHTLLALEEAEDKIGNDQGQCLLVWMIWDYLIHMSTSGSPHEELELCNPDMEA